MTPRRSDFLDSNRFASPAAFVACRPLPYYVRKFPMETAPRPSRGVSPFPVLQKRSNCPGRRSRKPFI